MALVMEMLQSFTGFEHSKAMRFMDLPLISYKLTDNTCHLSNFIFSMTFLRKTQRYLVFNETMKASRILMDHQT